jgi:hypothetical protein
MWSLDLNKWCKIQEDKIHEARRVFAFTVFSRVVKRTPVDTGHARANWLVSVNQPTDEYDSEKKGSPIKEGNLGITFSGDDTIYIQNNTPYIGKLEYGGYPKNPKNGGFTKEYTRKDGTKIGGEPKTVNGFSRQAPNGMVGAVIADAEKIWQAAVKAIGGEV